jgi:hypothetical protein
VSSQSERITSTLQRYEKSSATKLLTAAPGLSLEPRASTKQAGTYFRHISTIIKIIFQNRKKKYIGYFFRLKTTETNLSNSIAA